MSQGGVITLLPSVHYTEEIGCLWRTRPGEAVSTNPLTNAYDIQGSTAHCRMLAKCGIIADDEASAIIQGLQQVEAEIARGEFVFDVRWEDIHMHIERRLIELIGPVGGKLHTARSRNDQIALDMRLYLRGAGAWSATTSALANV